MSNNQLVPFGIILKPRGVHGELKLKLYNPDSDLLKKIKTIFVNERPYSVEYVKFAFGSAVIRLLGFSNPEEVSFLSGTEFCIERERFEKLKSSDEFYLADIKGYKVFDESGKPVGEITKVVSNAGQDLIFIEPLNEFIILQSPFFISFNHEEKSVKVRVPEYI